MWKNSLAIIAIGSLVTGSSFATPLNVKTMFMKDHTMKSPLVSKKHSQQFQFSGTWTGTCSYDGGNMETKMHIEEDSTQLSVRDLINEGEETFSFNVVKSESYSDKDWYDSYTSRLTKLNDNTLRLEGTGVFGHQLPSSDKDKGFGTGRMTTIAIVNNNQLMIDTNVKASGVNQNENFETNTKCLLKRAG